MPQKLSAFRYIKNNKRRISVLIVSLALSFLLMYVTQFLLSITIETVKPILIGNTQKVQYVTLASSSFGIDVDNISDEDLSLQYREKNIDMSKKLKTHSDIDDVFYCQNMYVYINPVIGSMRIRVPLLEKDQIAEVIDYFGTQICEGHFPENPGEIVLDRASMKNNNLDINEYVNEESYGKTFKVVGVLDCDSFFGCGIPSEKKEVGYILTILSHKDDISSELLKEGIEVRDAYDEVEDYKTNKEFLKTGVEDLIGNSAKYIYLGIIVLVSIALFIVYTMYLRDRRNEWCLYRSIGYSEKSIYFSIMRELMFTFVLAVIIGAAVVTVTICILNAIMIVPNGIKCRFINVKTLAEILCTYVFLIGMLQLPIKYALCKIKTIDAVDDDLY